MGTKDTRIDAYIERSADFAKPILKHLRELVHKGCPEVKETIKWGFASFDYKGPFCSMAAFKQHAVFGFWKAALLKDAGKFKDNNQNAMGHAGKITSLKDLPPDKIILSWIKEAAKLNDDGIKLPARKKVEKPPIEMPEDFKQILTKNKKAQDVYDSFSPSHKREYLEWITGAKTDETKKRRMEKTIEQLLEKKTLNWKYQAK